MKRIIALLLVLCLLLCACGKKQDAVETTGDTTPSTSDTVPQDTTEETQETTEAIKEIYYHPLTGEALEEPWSGRATAVMINNYPEAMPQCGTSQVDILCEVEVESSITRCLAVFSDLSDVGYIGSIRSARTPFCSLAASFDAPLVHCGGSNYALNAQYGASTDKIPNWMHIDEIPNPRYFFRNQDRLNADYAFEHTLFTTGESLMKALEDFEYNTPTEKTSFGFEFQEGIQLDGEKAEEITITFKGSKTTKMAYDAATGLYKMFQHRQDNVDGNSGKVLTFKNILVLYTEMWLSPNGVNVFHETLGSGEGYAAVNGQIVPILWSRPTVTDPYTYTLADGTPLVLDVGTTYLALVGAKHPIAYQ